MQFAHWAANVTTIILNIIIIVHTCDIDVSAEEINKTLLTLNSLRSEDTDNICDEDN